MIPGSKVMLKPEFDRIADFAVLQIIKPETGKIYTVEDVQMGYLSGSKEKAVGVFLLEIYNPPKSANNGVFYNSIIFNEIQPPLYVQGEIKETIASPEEFLIVKEKQLEEA